MPVSTFLFGSLAFRAMAVAATIVADAQMAAGGAAIYMCAQRCCTASPDGMECTQLPGIELFTLLHTVTNVH